MKIYQRSKIIIINCALIASMFFLAIPEVFSSSTTLQPLNLGDNLAQVKQNLSKKCESLVVRTLPRLLSVANENQSLIKCEGYKYFGSKHSLELMFSDDQLDVIQILGTQAEHNDLLSLLKQEHGEPSYSSQEAVYYQKMGISLRTKPHIITFVSNRMIRDNSQMIETR